MVKPAPLAETRDKPPVCGAEKEYGLPICPTTRVKRWP